MRAARAWLLRLIASLYSRGQDDDLATELESHLQFHVDDNISAGMTPEQARRAALLALGGVEATKERCRDRRHLPLVDALGQDVKYAARALRRDPGFTWVAMLTLALGIGATTTIFSLLDAVVLRPLPYADADRLAYIWAPNGRFADVPADAFPPSNADFLDLRRDTRTFSSLTMFDQRSFNLTAHGRARRVGGSRVTGDFFATLGVNAVLGRTIDRDDDQPGRADVAVISHALWQSDFGGDPGAVGSALLLNGRAYRIVGVAPSAFRYPHDSDMGEGAIDAAHTDVWLPLALSADRAADRTVPDAVAAVGRLAPGVSLAQAQVEMRTLFTRLDTLHAPEWRGSRPLVRSLVDTAVGTARPLMRLLLGAVAFVLLIACGNTAHLLLARAAARTREMGVRSALGAARVDLVRLALTEAVLLAGGGGAIGAAVAIAALRTVRVVDPGNIPRLDQATLDARVLAFGVVTSLLTGIACGMLPALGMSRANVAGLLRRRGTVASGPGSNRVRHVLIVAEITMAVVLLVGAGLLLHSYVNVRRVAPGFSSSTLTMKVALDERYGRVGQRLTFFQRLLTRVDALPGVEMAGAVDALPLSHSERATLFAVEGYPNRNNQFVHARAVTSRFFATMGTPIIAGRALADSDGTSGPPVVIVNQTFAKMYFNGQPAVGRHVRFVHLENDRQQPWSTVVGVVADVRHSSLEAEPPPQIYESLWQSDADRVYLVVRTDRTASDMAADVRRVMESLDSSVAIADVRGTNQLIADASARRRFEAMLVAVFASSALLLSAIGLYGLIAYSVRRRTTEIGVRVALGAQRHDVLGLVLGEGVRLALCGLAAGTVGAYGVTRILRSTLYRVAPIDPIAFSVVTLVVVATTILACYVPARRAVLVDPMEALRSE